MKLHKYQQGFTIVELLVVIVVIAILAAISVVAYTGIQNRAHDTAVQSDLSQIHKQLQVAAALEELPDPSSDPDADQFNALIDSITTGSYDSSQEYTIMVVKRGWGDSTDYDIAGISKSGKVFIVTEEGLARSITNWDEQRDYLNDDIAWINDYLMDDTVSQEDRTFLEGYLQELQAQLQEINQREAQGRDLWEVTVDADMGQIFGYTCYTSTPLGVSFNGGFVYRATDNQWFTASTCTF